MQDAKTNYLSINRQSIMTPTRRSNYQETGFVNSEFRDGLTVMQTRKKKN